MYLTSATLLGVVLKNGKAAGDFTIVMRIKAYSFHKGLTVTLRMFVCREID